MGKKVKLFANSKPERAKTKLYPEGKPSRRELVVAEQSARSLQPSSKSSDRDPRMMVANAMEMIANVYSQRAEVINRMLVPGRDLNSECGYPDHITPEDYDLMYRRNEIAETVVDLYPEESWAVDPWVYETERARRTRFEREWDELVERLNIFHYLERVDILSGIGHYGVLLFGLNDGGDLDDPVRGIDAAGNRTTRFKPLRVEYLQTFQEVNARVTRLETNENNPRFGQPVEYEIDFTSEAADNFLHSIGTRRVHWHRVMHVVDNRKSNDVFGKPRQRPVYNRLLDLQKLYGGSAEMFWKGAFPGFAFKVDPEYATMAGLYNDTDEAAKFKEGLRDEFFRMSHQSLQRYMALIGTEVTPLLPQVANPHMHIEEQLKAIAIQVRCPFRIFMGSETGKLASSQDGRTWNKRLKRRHQKYLTPLLLRPFVNRCILYGALPEPNRRYITGWPDLDTLSEQDRADVADKRATTLQKYMTGKVEQAVPLYEFLTIFMDLSPEQAEVIIKSRDNERAKLLKRMLEEKEATTLPNQNGNGRAGGADNAPRRNGKVPGGQNPRDVSADRSRTGAGASGNVR